MAQPQLEINGTDRFGLVQISNLNCKRSLEQTSVLDFVLEVQDGSYEPEIGHEIVLKDEDGSNIMGGLIVDQRLTRPAQNSNHHRIRVNPSSNRKLADKRTFNEVWTSTDAKTIVEDIIDSVLTDEGITKGTIEGDEADNPNFAIDIFRSSYQHISDVLDDLAARVGFYWKINGDRSLDFLSVGSENAPWDLDDSALQDRVQYIAPIKRDEVFGNYRNRQYVRGVEGILKSRTETFTAEAGQGAFELQYPIEELESITVNGTDETETRITTFENLPGFGDLVNKKWSFVQGERTIRTFVGFGLDEGDTVAITYKGRGKATIAVENTDEINDRAAIESGSGVHSAVFDGEFEDIEDAKAKGKALLEEHGFLPTEFQFDTYRKDLDIGQIIRVDLTNFGFTGEMMIVEMSYIDRGLQADQSSNLGRLKRRVKITDKKPAAFTLNKRESSLSQSSRDEEQTIIPSDASSSLKAETGSDKDDTNSDTDSDLDNDQVPASGINSTLVWGSSTDSGDLIAFSEKGSFAEVDRISGNFQSGGGLADIDGDRVAIVDSAFNEIDVVDLTDRDDPRKQRTSVGQNLGGFATGDGANTVWVISGASSTDVHEYSITESGGTWSVSFQQTHSVGTVKDGSEINGLSHQGGQLYIHSNGSPDDYTSQKVSSSFACQEWAIVNRTNGHGTMIFGDWGVGYRRDSDADVVRRTLAQGAYYDCSDNTRPFNNNWEGINGEDFKSLSETVQDLEFVS